MLECARRRPRAAARRQGRDQGRARSAAVSFADISGRAHWAAGGPIIGTHSWVFDQKTFDPKRTVAIGLPFAQIGVFSFSALVVEVEVDEATGQGARRRRLVGVRRRAGDQSDDGERPDRRRVRAGHGLRADRGDGLGRRAPRQPEPDGLQDPDDGRAAGDAAGLPRRIATSRAVRSAPRASARSASTASRRRSPTPSPTRPACACAACR